MHRPNECRTLQTKKSALRILLFSVAVVCLTACNSTKHAYRKAAKSLEKQIEVSPVFQKAFTGFALFDPVNQRFIHQYNADKYFTPASNTKIFTLYTCLNVLSDSLPALKYYQSGDSVIFVGTGDPSFLHPHLPADSTVLNFFTKSTTPLYYCSDNFLETGFGAGWAWDDYPYYFQAERSAFPVHGNVVSIHWPSRQSSMHISPDIFYENVITDVQLGGQMARFRRKQHDNIFVFNGQAPAAKGYENELPFLYSDSLLVRLLSKIGQREIKLLKECPIRTKPFTTLYSLPVDTVYRLMMQQSDNLIAEQLLLVCAGQLFDTLSSRMAIDYAKQKLLFDLPDEPIWKDGSGLSRYNLFTPRSIVKVLYKLHLEVGEDRLLGLFAAGGKSGTIRSLYGGKSEAYIFAKTGTLSNNHCLSGYLRTNKGLLLIFSFMHNNFPGNSSDYKKEMEKMLEFIHSKL